MTLTTLVSQMKHHNQLDHKVVIKILKFVHERNPFREDGALRNIRTGIEAGNNVNVNSAETVGKRVLRCMENKEVKDWSFQRLARLLGWMAKPALKLTMNQSMLTLISF